MRGIGAWSADIYLLMCLLRPDIWPAGDLALVQAARQVKNLPALPSQPKWRRLPSRGGPGAR